jgi:hypothetical protein
VGKLNSKQASGCGGLGRGAPAILPATQYWGPETRLRLLARGVCADHARVRGAPRGGGAPGGDAEGCCRCAARRSGRQSGACGPDVGDVGDVGENRTLNPVGLKSSLLGAWSQFLAPRVGLKSGFWAHRRALSPVFGTQVGLKCGFWAPI